MAAEQREMDVEVTNTSGVREYEFNTVEQGSIHPHQVWDDENDSFDSQDSSFDLRQHPDNSFSSDKRRCCGRRGCILCVASLLILATAAGVAVALLVPAKNTDRSTNAAASGNDGGTAAPTAAPTPQPLPPQCIPISDNVDSCLKNEMEQADADFCIDCVWRFLPENRGYCEPLETQICNVLRSCGCAACESDLAAYFDCQTSCIIDCNF